LRQKHVEFVMGTAVTFDIDLDAITSARRRALKQALDECIEWLHWVDRTFTTYSEASFVSRLGRGSIKVEDCPQEMSFIVDECVRFREATSGWFDPWAGPAGGFDPSGLVKGWAAQGVSDRLLAAGFDRHCVNAGGDVIARGRTSPGSQWSVGISHPLVKSALCAVISITDEAVATSGTAERGTHVWRPSDRSPATELASVSIVGPDLGAADVYATAAFAMGMEAPRWIACLSDIDAYIIDATGHEWSTPGFARRRTWPANPPPSHVRRGV
jgi:thiamine biosynthesis lipoprotein